jgi:hypothetical protein
MPASAGMTLSVWPRSNRNKRITMTAALAAQTLLIIISAIIFLILERVKPGRELPNAPG